MFHSTYLVYYAYDSFKQFNFIFLEIILKFNYISIFIYKKASSALMSLNTESNQQLMFECQREKKNLNQVITMISYSNMKYLFIPVAEFLYISSYLFTYLILPLSNFLD